MEVNPLLLGIGFIVGLDVSVTMFAGSILANFGILPLIGYFSALAQGDATVWNNPSVSINAMKVSKIPLLEPHALPIDEPSNLPIIVD